MVIRNVELETVCGVTSTLPENTLPEFAFAGKSNVGKSSLINALMNRKALARTSSQPGKTQTINFYNINGDLYYVDLPGYGYAKVPQSEKVKWGRMIDNYLHKSQMLKCVFLLVDIRHEPSANDKTVPPASEPALGSVRPFRSTRDSGSKPGTQPTMKRAADSISEARAPHAIQAFHLEFNSSATGMESGECCP